MTFIFEFPNWQLSTAGLVIGLFLLLVYILGLIIVFANVKFTFLRKFFPVDSKQADIDIADLKRIFPDYASYFERYDEDTSNYRKNYVNLKNKRYQHVVETPVNRENRPYYVMKVDIFRQN